MTAGEYNDTKEHVFHIFFNLGLKPKTWQGRRYCKGRLVPLTPAIRSSPVFFFLHVNGATVKEWTKNSAKLKSTSVLGIHRDLMNHKAPRFLSLQNEASLRFYFLWPGIR